MTICRYSPTSAATHRASGNADVGIDSYCWTSGSDPHICPNNRASHRNHWAPRHNNWSRSNHHYWRDHGSVANVVHLFYMRHLMHWLVMHLVYLLHHVRVMHHVWIVVVHLLVHHGLRVTMHHSWLLVNSRRDNLLLTATLPMNITVDCFRATFAHLLFMFGVI